MKRRDKYRAFFCDFLFGEPVEPFTRLQQQTKHAAKGY